MDQFRFEDETMTRLNEIWNHDALAILLRRLSRQLRTLVRRAGYHPQRRHMRVRRG